MTSADPPGIVFVGFFLEKYLLAIAKYIMVIPARPPSLCEGEAPDEKSTNWVLMSVCNYSVPPSHALMLIFVLLLQEVQTYEPRS